MISLRSVLFENLLILFSIDIRCCLIHFTAKSSRSIDNRYTPSYIKSIVRLQDDFVRYKQTVPLLTMIK
jgi:hypothetical protein